MVSKEGVGNKMNESQKMLNIIHNNCKKEQERIATMEKNNKKRDIKTIVFLIIGILITLTLIGLINKHNLETCIKNGGTETFCRYAGE